jgi:diguanylate cyclase (GGDEF)-like protein/PAS domain S-box-containing protein
MLLITYPRFRRVFGHYNKYDFLRLPLVTAIYILLAWLVLTLATANGNVTIFWAPGGLGLAALIIFGKKLWPAIFTGALVAGLIVNDPFWVSLGLATGNTLESLSGAWLLSKLPDFSKQLTKPYDFIYLVLVAVLVSTISALIGPFTLLLADYISSDSIFYNIVHWWQGDCLGIILLTPLLLIWQHRPDFDFKVTRRIELLLLLLTTLIAGQIIFLDWLNNTLGVIAKGYWLHLFVVWAAIRFGKHGTSLVLVLIATQAFLGAKSGIGLFAKDIDQTGLQNYWFYILVITTVSFFLTLTISARQVAQQKLRETSQELNNYFNQALDLFCIADTDGYFRKLNPQWEKVLGYPVQELENKPFLELVHPDDIETTIGALQQLSSKQPVINFVNRYRHRNGDFQWIEWCSMPQGELIYAAARDISVRKINEEQLRLADIVFQNSNQAMLVVDANTKIIRVNPAFTQITGYCENQVLGQNPRILRSGQHTKSFYSALWKQLLSQGQWQGEIINRKKNGDIYIELLEINTNYNDLGEVVQWIGIFSDITKKKKAEEEIWYQANYDTLTRLPNRRLFSDRLQQEINKANRESQHIGLLFLDLDNFKAVNDSLGHHSGDKLLIQAAQRILACVRKTDTVSRLSGDEFTVIITNLVDLDELGQIAQNIISALVKPFELGKKKEKGIISASIGIAVYPEDSTHSDELLRYADIAMYNAKQNGRNGYCYFGKDNGSVLSN